MTIATHQLWRSETLVGEEARVVQEEVVKHSGRLSLILHIRNHLKLYNYTTNNAQYLYSLLLI